MYVYERIQTMCTFTAGRKKYSLWSASIASHEVATNLKEDGLEEHEALGDILDELGEDTIKKTSNNMKPRVLSGQLFWIYLNVIEKT